jgi:hypothetical protein
MSDGRAPPSLATPPSVAEKESASLRPLLEAYNRAMLGATAGGLRGRVARRLMAARVQRDLRTIGESSWRAVLSVDPDAKVEYDAAEQFASSQRPPGRKAAFAAGIVVIADVIVSLTASVTEPEQLILDRTAELDLTNPLSILALVRATLDSSLGATVFLAWTILLAAAVVLLPLLPGARRYRRVYCDVALGTQQRTYRTLGLQPPAQPIADLGILVVPAMASLFLGVHLFLMAAQWPVDDGRDGARVALGVLCCVAFAIAAAYLLVAWRRRPRSTAEVAP